MAACGMTRYDDSIDVEIVEFCITNDPFEGAAAVFHGSGSQGNGSHAILHVYNVPSALEIREELREGAGTVSENPPPAMDVDDRRNALLG